MWQEVGAAVNSGLLFDRTGAVGLLRMDLEYALPHEKARLVMDDVDDVDGPKYA